ncbi:hypothetical protein VitviT2T_011121 [Vitis vinifera]|uniref:Programmed cell death protein 2-like n=2 Tax=Vitis vinifera TaxID=29760 RepID=F6H4B0_VITVI|nr:uncharacterized protein LOC100255896 [Vitis vinifera]RVW55150.1 Programmed cell death protein 2-like [Vitis vinifera]WJZ92102.1 hypothetical protein VitviT2T_011121 [Vitis vinifera]|eukprot:XP_019076612.1 PREDICTED: programmed cell death protein 2-like [Vitis vinifera]
MAMGERVLQFLGMPGPWADDNSEPSDHYTIKIGGLPDWPVPQFPSAITHILRCAACQSNLCLVAQVYAPISGKSLKIEERVIYIFGCVAPECEKRASSWRAIRVQKLSSACEEVGRGAASPVSALKDDRCDDLWTFGSGEEGDDGSGEDIDLEELGRALSVAASLASHSKKQMNNQDTKTTEKHLPLSLGTRVVAIDAPVLPCFYTYTQEEPSTREVTVVSSNYSQDSEQEETWEKESYEYDRTWNADRTYLKFKKSMDAFPEQCFRYAYGGKPLLATAKVENPGTCKLCGGPRHYEMQLMPPLLYFLQEGANDCKKHLLDHWNWMTLVVYTCSKSCSHFDDKGKFNIEGWVVAEEAVVIQFEESLQESVHKDYFS